MIRVYTYKIKFKDGSSEEQSVYAENRKDAKDLALAHALWGRYSNASDSIMRRYIKSCTLI